MAAYIRQDAVMGRFFEPFLFEELPAKDVSAQQAYRDPQVKSEKLRVKSLRGWNLKAS